MAEVREVHEIDEVQAERRRQGFLLPFLMFLLGGALIAAAVFAVLNVHSIIAWPAGQVSLGSNTSGAEPGNAAVTPPAAATAPSVIAPSATTPPATQNEPPTVDTTLPPAATTPPAATEESSTAPAESPPSSQPE